MSFFDSATKKQIINDSPPPTRYNVKFQTQIKTQCAPFNSTTLRSKQKIKQVTPGPGDYNLLSKQKANKLFINNKQYKLIGQQKFQSVFRSRSERFKNLHNVADIPPPGHYDISNSKIQSQKPKIQRKVFINNIAKKIPSIPTNLLGYKEDEKGILVKIQNKTSPNIVGPGSYDPLIKSRNNIVKWKKKQTQTYKDLEQNDNSNIGPGTYQIITNQKKKLISSSFTSRTQRFENQMNSSHYSNVKPYPGPGHYGNDILKRHHSSNSHFGSTTKRFKIKNSQIPGPGEYTDQPSKQLMKKSNSAFNTTSKKIPQFQPKHKPGPGTYQLQKKISRSGSKNVIIGFQQRFRDTNKLQINPGPGNYINQQKKISKTMAVWRPQTKPLIKKEEQTRPQPGTYNLDIYDIEKKLRTTINNSENKLSIKQPFNTTQKRFRYEIEQQENKNQIGLKAAIGKLKQKLVVRNPGIIKPSIPFNSTTQRKQIIKRDIPGPAIYKNSTVSWIKKSFNIKMANL